MCVCVYMYSTRPPINLYMYIYIYIYGAVEGLQKQKGFRVKGLGFCGVWWMYIRLLRDVGECTYAATLNPTP